MINNVSVTIETRWVPPAEQELPTVPEHPRSYLVFSRVRVAQSLVFFVVFCISMFVLFHLANTLSVIQFTASDYPFGILRLFFISVWQIVLIVYNSFLFHMLIDLWFYWWYLVHAHCDVLTLNLWHSTYTGSVCDVYYWL